MSAVEGETPSAEGATAPVTLKLLGIPRAPLAPPIPMVSKPCRSARLCKPIGIKPQRLTRLRNPVERLNLYNSPCLQANLASSMLQTAPVPSGLCQIKFRNNDKPARLLSYDKLNQQHLASLQWDKLHKLLTSGYTTMNSFITEHQTNTTGINKLLEYLNPVLLLLATIANKEDNPRQ
eukprot:jgi/Psemu1/2294/gm1.2294_g